MKVDQVITAAYLVLGIAFGIISNYFNKTIGSFILAIILPMAVYLFSLYPLFTLVKLKKKKWLVQNSIITFFLVWFVVWIVVYNM